jgi:hypothetical protein
MEWVLQVLDECDDALATVGHWFLGVRREFALVILSAAGAQVLIASLYFGAGTLLLAGAALAVSVATAFSLRRRFEHTLSRL